LTTTVERTVRWYRRWLDQPTASMADACAADIDAYLAAAERGVP
jgi:hypothetical protein